MSEKLVNGLTDLNFSLTKNGEQLNENGEQLNENLSWETIILATTL